MPSNVVLCTECVWGQGEWLLPSISVVGPLQSSGCPAPSQFPLRLESARQASVASAVQFSPSSAQSCFPHFFIGVTAD